MLSESDLVLGMTRAHVWEAALMGPEIVPHSFVIGELARLNDEMGGRLVGETLDAWLDRLHEFRNEGRRGPRAGDEIPDPYGRRKGVHARVARRLQELVLQLGDCAFEPLYELSEARWREGRLIWRPGKDGDPG
jgi:protein-tyrosine-phosphatase